MSGGKHIVREPKRVQLQAESQGIKKAAHGVIDTTKKIKGLAAVGLVIDFFWRL